MTPRELKHLLTEKVPEDVQKNTIFEELLSAVSEHKLESKKELSDWLDSAIKEGKDELARITANRIRLRVGVKIDHLKQMKAVVSYL